MSCVLACNTQTNVSSHVSNSALRASGPLEATPSAAAVQQALDARRDAVSRCADGHTGWATVDVTFGTTGHVTTALVRVPFAGTPAGSCVARAVREARIPPFASGSFHIAYMFRVQ